MKRNLTVLFLLAILFMVFMVDQAEAWPGWWGPPHRFRVVRVSYYHWYPQYRPCYRYRPAYVYYPCYNECWCDYCYDGCWHCGQPYAYYCYSPCWYVYFWVGWGYYTNYCYYYRPYPSYYGYWYHRYPPPYYYDYYYAGYDYGYHHPWHDYYWDGHGRWRDGYAYRDKPYRAGNIPGKRPPHYAYNDKPKDKPPQGYGKDKELAKAPIPRNKKNPYELAKVDPGKSIRSSKSRDELSLEKDRTKEGSEKRMYKTPGVREKDPSKYLDDRKKVGDREYDGVRGKESDKDDFGGETPASESRKKDEDKKKEEKKKDNVSTEKYSKYAKDGDREKNVKKKDEASRKKETYSKSKSESKNKSKSESNAKNNSSSSRFSSPRRDNNSSSNVRRPSSSKREGKR